MRPIHNIRTNVFGVSQIEFATICGVRQSTISRWELGLSFPGLEHMDKVRAEAKRRGHRFCDLQFFEVPDELNAPSNPLPDDKAGRAPAASVDPIHEIEQSPAPVRGTDDRVDVSAGLAAE